MKIMIDRHLIRVLLPAVFAIGLLGGCGTTPLALTHADPQADFSRYNSLAVRATTHGAAVSPAARERIANFIVQELMACCSTRFHHIAIDSAQPQDLTLHLKLTVYDEGNRFARFMLAGLGSMQIHGQVELVDGQSSRLLSAGEAGKTFAWGGIYGAITGIEDIEKDFAKEVVKGFRESLGLGIADLAPATAQMP